MKPKCELVFNESPGEKVLQSLVCNFVPAKSRIEMLEGREHTVIPMVILTEGVHKGSTGPALYEDAELAKTPVIWNHRPIVVYHPERDGVGLSACDPGIINNRKVGMMLNTKHEKGRLKSEAWIEKDRADKVDERIMEAVRTNNIMELSTGLFMDLELKEGEWNGEPYKGIARNFRPDHLALLPDKTGACSIKDGAGFCRNEKTGEKKGEKKFLAQAFTKFLERVGLVDNEMSYNNIQTNLHQLINNKLNPDKSSDGPYVWIADVFSNFFIYEDKSKLFRLGYSSSNDEVSLGDDDPVEVKREIRYRTVAGALVGNQDQSPENHVMNKTQMIIAILAANAGWAEKDKPALEAMNDNQISAIHRGIAPPPPAPPAPTINMPGTQPQPSPNPSPGPGAIPNPTPAPAIPPNPTAPNPTPPQPQATSTTNANPQPPAVLTVEEYIKAAPVGVGEVLRNSMDSLNAEKAQLVEAITKNANNPFTANDLNNRPIGELRALAKLAGATVQTRQPNYSGQGMAPELNSETEEPLAVPTMNFEPAKK